ncbi:hypothetical protein [Streptomyces sp. NPDC093591]|uniref:hypothetical protein n=1 Tax=Streptomyces sp. NPDC093591 TaxID=3366044 RepID=UPI003829299E
MKYRALLLQTASCVVEFEAPEDATPEHLEAAALEADTPTLCHQCAGSGNQSLNIEGEWSLMRDDETGKPEIHVDEDGAR